MPKKKVKKTKTIAFARPPWAKELFTKEIKSKFDELPGFKRHFIRQFLSHGNMQLAAKQANIEISRSANEHLLASERRQFKDVLVDAGLTSEKLAMYLIESLDAKDIVVGKHGEFKEKIDHKSRLRAIDMVLKLRGEYNVGFPGTKPKEGAVDLFEDIDLED